MKVVCMALTGGLALSAASIPAREETPLSWFEAGRQAVETAATLKKHTGVAHNVILFIGDGMGISTVTAARILEGQLRGQSGEENLLSFEGLPYLALSKTYNTDQQTPDSAGTMSAIMTGVKTRAGVIAVDQRVRTGNCASAKNAALETFLEQAEESGLSTGVVTTARLTHATPAATYAHVPDRSWEDDSRLSKEAKAHGCRDIARQLVEFSRGNGLEVALGGGRRGFLPDTAADPEYRDKAGSRKDGRDLTREWLQKYPNAAYVWNKAQFDAIDPKATDHLLGLFEPSHMAYEHDRPGDSAGEPSLSEMTAKAMDILSRNPKGYFLMVEAGRIDHAHHAGNAFRALTDTIELSRAVQLARKKASENTLIIVTADHSHVFTMGGYASRGNPILGKVDMGGDSKGYELAADGKPYTTLSYANGRGAAMLEKGGDTHYGVAIAAGRNMDLGKIDTADQGFHQQALVPLEAETHGGEDVAIYAGGPGAWLFHGVQEQNVIYHVMRRAAALEKRR
ncbi:alkaline phosphatase [Thiolapillus sp.]